MSRKTTMLEAIEMVCNRLSERSATLFLGAGINANVRNDNGEKIPLGQGLSNWLARDLLNEPNLLAALDEIAEMARFRLGDRAVNEYLYDKFSRFNPGTAHLVLVQLPCHTIYTTHYDLLVQPA